MSDTPQLDWVIRVARDEYADYAQVRMVMGRQQRFSLENQRIHAQEDMLQGAAVRVLKQGHWAHAVTSDLTRASLDAATRAAIGAAEAAALLAPGTAGPAPDGVAREVLEPTFEQDPFAASKRDKARLLRELDGVAREAAETCRVDASLTLRDAIERIVNTDGADLEQRHVGLRLDLDLEVCRDSVTHLRSTPLIAGSGGWELVDFERLRNDVHDMREGALAMLEAEQTSLAGLSIVADPVFVANAAFHLLARVASARVEEALATRIVSLWTAPDLTTGLSRRAYDAFARPVATERVPIVEAGVVRAIPDVRLWRAHHTEQSYATWGDLELASGDGAQKKFVRASDGGILVEGVRALYLDDDGHVIIEPQTARRIEEGAPTRAIRHPRIETTIETFWNSCAALAGAETAINVAVDVAPGVSISVRAPFARFEGLTLESAR